MSVARITIELPAELVERAKAANVPLDNVTANVIDFVEKQIEQQEAIQYFFDAADALSSLPAEEKPTDEEIIEEVRQVRREQAAQRES